MVGFLQKASTASPFVALPIAPSWARPRPQLARVLGRERQEPLARAGGRSHRLLKFEHELVDRLAARWLDREVARILGVAPEIAFGDQLESRRLDFATQRAFLDAMEALADGYAIAGFRGMVGDHEHPAGLERRVELAVHLGAVDRHVGGVVVEEQKRDEVEVAHIGGQWIVERPRQAHNVLAARRFQPRLEPTLRALADVRGILTVDDAARGYRARHQFRAVAAARAISSTFMPGCAPVKAKSLTGSRRLSDCTSASVRSGAATMAA